jgi:hypothetical protein
MTEEQLEKIRVCARAVSSDQKIARVTCKCGDVLEGFALFVSDAERDVIFDLRSSNNPDEYRTGRVYSVQWDDISDFETTSIIHRRRPRFPISRVTRQLAASKQGRFLERKPREPREPSTLFPVLWHQVIQTTVFRCVRSIPSASRSRQSVRSFISV